MSWPSHLASSEISERWTIAAEPTPGISSSLPLIGALIHAINCSLVVRINESFQMILYLVDQTAGVQAIPRCSAEFGAISTMIVVHSVYE